MPITLFERVRRVTSTREDDFFDETDLLFFVNEANSQIVSRAIRTEMQMGRSLRCLDKLRRRAELAVNTNDELIAGSLYRGSVIVSEQILLEFDLAMRVKVNNRPIINITPFQLKALMTGSLAPEINEGYYYLRSTDDHVILEVYSHESATVTIEIEYYKKPTELQMVSPEVFPEVYQSPDLPKRFTQALVYYAGGLLEQQEFGDLYERNMTIYEQQMQQNLY